MNIQSELQPKPLPSRSTRAVKKFVIFICILVVMILGVFALGEYNHYQNQRAVEKMAQTIQDIQKADYEEAMKDMYGGKTPQETLSLYIAAVEKSDYELASKYFIGTKQKEELEKFKSANPSGIEKYIETLKFGLNSKGSFSDDKRRFVIHDPVLIDFKQYPNGIWKIIEI